MGSEPLRNLRLLDCMGSNFLFFGAVLLLELSSCLETPCRTRLFNVSCESLLFGARAISTLLRLQTLPGFIVNKPIHTRRMNVLWAFGTIFLCKPSKDT
ncbi:hypothetical protein BVRB_6g153910 isoform B [Beta vulgaris subsp. vulgaris]|nr:hypothetical protein BVRB_6g153910 isoform B [Beta vulgaris subsp. vulgaris]